MRETFYVAPSALSAESTHAGGCQSRNSGLHCRKGFLLFLPPRKIRIEEKSKL